MMDDLPFEASTPGSVHGSDNAKPLVVSTEKIQNDRHHRIETIARTLSESSDEVLVQVEMTLGIRVRLPGRSPRKLKWYERWQTLRFCLAF